MNLSGRIIGDRYHLYDRIREDRYGSTYHAAADGVTGTPCLFTVYDGASVSRRIGDVMRFKADIRKLMGAAHENCLAIRDLGSLFDYCYVVTDPREGPTLASLLRDGAPVPPLMDLALDCARGLAFVHGREVTLRNLSPENILIVRGRAVLINAGSASLFTTGHARDLTALVSLAGYLAPEQTGLLDRPIDERGDLFSLGVVLWRLATGKDPFTAADLSTTLYRVATHEPSAAECSGHPAALAAIIARLMAKDPDERYQAAAGLVADLEALAAGAIDLVPGSGDRPSAPRYHTEMTGRAGELAILTARLDEAMKGRPSLCIITGAAGLGKSRLAVELADRALARGVTVLAAKCNQGYETSPYAAVSDLMASWLRSFRAMAGDERAALVAALHHALGERMGLLASLHPAMRDIMDQSVVPTDLDPKTATVRFHDTAARFFLFIASTMKGLVIIIDDLQWCDEGTLAIVGVLLESIADQPMMLVTAARDNEAGVDRRLTALRDAASIHSLPPALIATAPLHEDDTRTLVRRILGASTSAIDEAAVFVHRRARGNVLFTITLLQTLADNRLLHRDGGAWSFDESAAERSGLPGSQLEIILDRLRTMEPQHTRILALAAAMGREWDLTELFGICGGDSDQLVAAVDRALALQVLAPWRARRNTYIFAHDRIREALYRSVSAAERAEAHRRIAAYLETSEPGDRRDYELAHHHLLAGNDAAFLGHAVTAALRARERYDYDDARSLLMTARALLPADDRSLGDRIQRELGTIGLITGDFAAAVEAFAELAPRQEDPVLRAATLAGLAEAHYRLGDWDACEAAARRGLSLLGQRLPAGTIGLLLAIGNQALRLLLAVGLIGRRAVLPARPEDQAALDIYRSLLQNYLFHNDGLRFVHASIRMAVIAAVRMGPSKELSMALIGVGLIFSALARFGIARRIIVRARAISVAMADCWGEGLALGFLGLLCEFTGRYRLGIDRWYRRSELIFTEVGDIKNLGIVHIGLAQSHLFRADYPAALRHATETDRIARKIGDRFFIGMAMVYFARIARETGDRAAAREHAQRALAFNRGHGLWQNYCAALVEHASLTLMDGDAAGAMRLLEEARDLEARSTFSPQHVIQLHGALVEACLADLAARGRLLHRAERRRLMRQIRSESARALARGRRWVSHLGMAWRVRAAWLAMAGRRRAAERCLLKAIDQCRALGNRHELARACYEYSLLLVQTQRSDAARDYLESAYLLYREIGAREGSAQCGAILGVTADLESGADLNRLARLERRQALRDMAMALQRGDAIWHDTTHIVERIVQATGSRGGYLFRDDGKTASPQPLYGSEPQGHEDWLLARRALELVSTEGSADPVLVEVDDAPQILHKAPTPCYLIPLAPVPGLTGCCCLMAPLYARDLSPEDRSSLTEVLSHALYLLAGHRQEASSLSEERSPLTESAQSKIDRAIAYIQEHYHAEISREGLATHLGLSPNYFGKLFRDYTGKKINEYINDLRLEQAMSRLRDTDERIIDIAYAVGFENLRTFNRSFQKKNAIQPQRYRELYRQKSV